MDMNILVLGGTGIIGKPLVKMYADEDNCVYVTSRLKRISESNNIIYLLGDGKEDAFLRECLKRKYDIIVDFMSYTTEAFQKRYQLLLGSTKRYIFISSARVYAETSNVITENTERLLDYSTDEEYLQTDEYALAKARQEDILYGLNSKYWTVIRPSITYGKDRLQLGAFEKENWLYRAIHGRSIVFSYDLYDKLTTMTTAYDVACGIKAVSEKAECEGETFHITYNISYTWNDILSCYLKVLQDVTGTRPKVYMTEKTVKLKDSRFKYQIIYCRYFNRIFDNRKIGQYIDVAEFKDTKVGIEEALRAFLEHPSFQNIDWRLEAWIDKDCGEFTPLNEIPGLKKRVFYLCYRYNLDFIIETYIKFKDMCRKKGLKK